MNALLAALLGSAALVWSGGSPVITNRPALLNVRPPLPLRVSAAPKGTKTLYDQNGNGTAVSIYSDYFDSGSLGQYDSQAADDFVVPSGQVWIVREVDVTGVYAGSSNETSDGVNVFFYADKRGVPGKTIATLIQAPFTDSNGSFAIQTGRTRLRSGKYWVSVQNWSRYPSQAYWNWETSSVQNNGLAVWRRPLEGGPCQQWNTLANCFDYNPGPDLMFTLKGVSKLR